MADETPSGRRAPLRQRRGVPALSLAGL